MKATATDDCDVAGQVLISVIVPTMCEARRAAELRRAVASVLQQDVAVELLVVVNGARVDERLLSELSAEPRLRVMQLPEGNVSLARLAGLRQSRGDYFCFLDDDDEFLPMGLAQRLQAFDGEVDVVVSNGYLCLPGAERVMVPPAEAAAIPSDPMGAFLRENWFASPAAMFRRAGVDAGIFDLQHPFFEWTLVFFRLYSAGARFHFLDALTYRFHTETQVSASKSSAYAQACPEVLHELWSSKALMKRLEPRHRRHLRVKLAAAYNGLALAEMKAGRMGAAWHAHLQSLIHGGFSYLAFTRKLVF